MEDLQESQKWKFPIQQVRYIEIKKEGIYNFSTLSDDGSKLFIDGEEIVNNNGPHGAVEAFGSAALRKGYHKIKIVYFDAGGGNELKVFWQNGNDKREEIPANVLFHQQS